MRDSLDGEGNTGKAAVIIICYGCRQEISSGQETIYRQNGTEYHLCSQCASILREEVADQPRPQPQVNYLGGLVVGLAAAVLMAGVWYGLTVLTGRMFAYVAILLGAAIGGGMRMGAGNRGNLLLQVLSGGLTLVTMALSEYFIVRHFVLADLAVAGAPLLAPAGLMVKMVVEGLKASPLTMLMWVIAVGLALLGAGPEGHKRKSLLS